MALLKIYHIWMIKRPSGLCLVDAQLKELPNKSVTDGLLVGGLFSSYLSFTQKILNEEIRVFTTENYQIIFDVHEHYFLAVLTEKKINTSVVDKFIKMFNENVLKIHPELLEEDFDGNIEIYEKIQASLEKMTELSGIKLIKYIRSRKKEADMVEKLRKLQEDIEKL